MPRLDPSRTPDEEEALRCGVGPFARYRYVARRVVHWLWARRRR